MTLALTQPTTRWQLRDSSAHLNGIPRFPRITATVLAARGITTRPQADVFYKPHLAPAYDPMELPGMQEAVLRTRKAIANRELIGLFGDFDVDGVTSLAVLKQGLEPLGANVKTYIPERFSEGYGLNIGAIDRLQEAGVSLLITADCGISSVPEVDHANELGLDVIILDHHTVPDELPAALAAVNPKRTDSPYPFDELAAVGVSFRFLQVLHDAMGVALDESLIDLVALGTVVDVAPLIDENRAIVTRGLEMMRGGLRPGLEALAGVARVDQPRIVSETLGFAFGPRMNAAGRLAHADRALELMLSGRGPKARELADELDALNRKRQQQTEDMFAAAEEQVAEGDDPVLMVASPEFHAGIVGLIAARLAEKYGRPAIALSSGPVESRASARSIPQFDIVTAIRRQKDLLVRHGGHRAAAGFTVRNEHIAELRTRLNAYAGELLQGVDLRRVIIVDAETPLSDVHGIDVRGLMRFEPCGQGNPRPVMLSRGVELRDSRTVGADGSHLKLLLRDGPAVWNAIAFRQGDAELSDRIDIVYSLREGWRGGAELEVLDLAPSEAQHPLEIERG